MIPCATVSPVTFRGNGDAVSEGNSNKTFDESSVRKSFSFPALTGFITELEQET